MLDLLSCSNRNHHIRRYSFFILLLAAFTVFSSGCQKGAEDELRNGRAALAAQDAAQAERHFQQALKLDPGLIEARRLLADVYILNADYQKAEDSLQALWQDLGLDDESRASAPESRLRGQLINDQFSELYRRWAETLQTQDHPAKLEEVLQKGLAQNPRSSRMNTLMVEFYEKQGERHVERGEKEKAAELFEKIIPLRTFSERRQEARQRAANLRAEAFKERARQRFNADMKASLEEAERYDSEKDRVLVAVQTEVDRRLDPRQPEHRAHAQKLALRALAQPLGDIVVSLVELPEDSDFTGLTAPAMDIVEESFSRGQYALAVSVTVDALIDMGFRYTQAQEQRHSDTEDGADSESETDKSDDSTDTDTSLTE